MLPIRTILHPTDFSEPSKYAFQIASALARDYGARLVVLHVATPPVVAYGEAPVDPELLQFDEEEARDRLSRLLAADPGVRAEHLLKTGDPATEILVVSEAYRADLIVMGTHGRTGLARLLMGSVAEQVVRKAACPVLTLKAPVPTVAPASNTPEGAGGRRQGSA